MTACRVCASALLAGLLACAAAAEPAPTTAQAALDLAREAHRLRGEHARAAATWAIERQRLEALIVATEAETARLQREVAAAEARTREAETRLAALGSGSDLDTLRARLAAAGTALGDGLRSLSARLPPGAVAVPAVREGEAGFDAAVRALEASERAAGAVTVEVVTGSADGRPEAVKLLRVAGAAAWWVSLDATRAGTIRIDAQGLALVPVDAPAQRAAIIAALLQAESRGTPAVELLPGGGL